MKFKRLILIILISLFWKASPSLLWVNIGTPILSFLWKASWFVWQVSIGTPIYPLCLSAHPVRKTYFFFSVSVCPASPNKDWPPRRQNQGSTPQFPNAIACLETLCGHSPVAYRTTEVPPLVTRHKGSSPRTHRINCVGSKCPPQHL